MLTNIFKIAVAGLLLTSSVAFAETENSKEKPMQEEKPGAVLEIKEASNGAPENKTDSDKTPDLNVLDIKNIILDLLPDAKVEEADKPEIMVSYKYLPTDAEALNNYREAEKLFYEALNAEDTETRKNSLAKAIELISKSCTTDKEAVCSQFLASRIYRAYGGLAYANKYYQQAVKICSDGLVKDFECRQAHLDLALLFWAGDSRFAKDYDSYVHKAEMHANEVLNVIKNLKKPDGRAFYQAALASMIVNNTADANSYMKKALAENYITPDEYKKACEDIIENKFTAIPVKEEVYLKEFGALSFGMMQ